MQTWAERERRSGKTIAFVPTMGFFHQGHVSLMDYGRSRADRLVVSLFVNPLQFGAGEDFERYPRDEDRDRMLAEAAGSDVLFLPSREELYPDRFQTYVDVEQVARGLCGASRPGHFRGVATVVCKLFHLVKPHWAVFGLKDYQQVVVIRQMVRDLDLDVEVVPRPIVREADGLAMSSRNVYLSPEERRAARSLSASLEKVRQALGSGERISATLISTAARSISAHPKTRIDYIRIVDPDTLEELEIIANRAVLLLAVWVGRTRLIDNCLLERPSSCPA
jgi:pantoate--beta-alanine ligase